LTSLFEQASKMFRPGLCHLNGVLASVCLALGVGYAPASLAQTTFEVAPPIVVLDRDRLFQETAYGRSILADLERRANDLAQENRTIELELSNEEQALTERRPSLSVDEFRALADAFDEKVQAFREEQDAKARAVQQLSETSQQDFIEQVIPILADVLRERGALVVMDRRDVFLSADSIDITNEAIARIDATLGDGVSPVQE